MKLTELFDGQWPALVMFDLDGTLLDSVPDLTAAVNRALGETGRPSVTLEQVRDWVGNGVRVLVRRALAGSSEHAGVDDKLAEEMLQRFNQAYGGDHILSTVYPGVIEFLDTLSARAIPMAIVTNKAERFVAPLLLEKGLAGYFDRIIGGDTLPWQKPSPEPLLHVLAEAGVEPTQALFIGDSRSDVRAAAAAGVPCIALSYGYNHGRPISEETANVVDDLRELL